MALPGIAKHPGGEQTRRDLRPGSAMLCHKEVAIGRQVSSVSVLARRPEPFGFAQGEGRRGNLCMWRLPRPPCPASGYPGRKRPGGLAMTSVGPGRRPMANVSGRARIQVLFRMRGAVPGRARMVVAPPSLTTPTRRFIISVRLPHGRPFLERKTACRRCQNANTPKEDGTGAERTTP